MSDENALGIIEQPPTPAELPAPQPVADEQAPENAAPVDIERAIQRLPTGMQPRLAEIVRQGGGVAELIRGVEEALPEFLRSATAPAERVQHPSGDAFFTGEGGNLSDAEAEEVARQQLMRSGLLRGQRVSVAD